MRVLVVTDSAELRAALPKALAGEPSVELLGVVPPGALSEETLEARMPEAVALATGSREDASLTTLAAARKRHPGAAILLFPSPEVSRNGEDASDRVRAAAADLVARIGHLAASCAREESPASIQSRESASEVRAVVIASGGFEGNPEMMASYIGPTARYLRPVARGGYYNRGEGIRLALALGAAPAGDFSSFHAEPLDPRSPAPEALVMNFPYGILVNRKGHRFTDEAPGPVDVNYDHISRAIKDEPDGIAWVVFDQSIHDVPNWKKSIRTDQPPIQSDSIANLAAACGISLEGLEKTVFAYNAACTAGEFNALRPDGLSTRSIDPIKSNWARPIERGPYMAYPIVAGICFTYGGIKTNRNAEVIDADGRPVPGLYAAGEATGLYYQVYTGATSVLRGAVFGKIAGENAAAVARQDSSPSP
jgi:succinate dehydrogenase/fumarate reductase flavoprotein subunit